MLLLDRLYIDFIEIIDFFVYLALNFVILTFFIRLEVLYFTFLSKFTILCKFTVISSTSVSIFTDITTIYSFTHIQPANISRSTFLLYLLS